MKLYSYTVEAIAKASEPISDEPWDYDTDSRELQIPPYGYGKVSTHSHDVANGVVSLELHGLTSEQAEAILHLLSRRPESRVTYDIPSPDVGKGICRLCYGAGYQCIGEDRGRGLQLTYEPCPNGCKARP